VRELLSGAQGSATIVVDWDELETLTPDRLQDPVIALVEGQESVGAKPGGEHYIGGVGEPEVAIGIALDEGNGSSDLLVRLALERRLAPPMLTFVRRR
jgi:hypothetical protein